ncbi:DHA2 family efflux MFS transporter permease subunit [Crenalkalicoccus roseus]|uniref:DHA2 family efflux MFS transporter permease subunit n=1 Tax=Crenalkalicoccus roseus TaxID=1485588 RepID=UPI001F02C8B2|nr:DHA2 family efflux MFS transporter permease subunit [Crenalkalicoccus roseus]
MSEAAAGPQALPRAPRPRSVEALFARYGPSYRLLVAFTAMIGTVSTILSSTIVNVAIPDIMGAFGIGQDRAQLLAAGFLAATTGTMLLTAWAVEAFGFRATYLAAMAIFLAGSALGGLAPNEAALVAGRVMQGASAGLLQPLGMQVVFQVFPPERRGTAMGLFAVGVVMAPALGPALGGVVTDAFGWRAVFLAALPLPLLGLGLGWLFMPGRPREGKRPRFDAVGFLLLNTAIFALLAGLASGQQLGWRSDAVVLELTVAALAATGFVLWELRTPAPMLDPRIFANPAFAGGAAVAFVYGAALFGTTYLAPLFVQLVQGYTATRAGLLLMPAGLAMIVCFPISGRIADRVPPVGPVAIGLVVFALSSWLMVGVDTQVPFWTLALWILLGRVGLSLAMPSMNTGSLRALPPRFLGQGAGAINFSRQFGGALGINGLSIALEQRTQFHAEALTASQDGTQAATLELRRLIEGLLAQEGVPQTLWQAGFEQFLGRMIHAQALMLGFRDGFLIAAVVCLVAVLPALLMRRRAAG